MNTTRTTAFVFTAFAILSTGNASAALFDTLDSVDTLKVIAAQKAETNDRMPAGKVSAPKDENSTEGAQAQDATPTSPDSK